jgi:hypothetical protein
MDSSGFCTRQVDRILADRQMQNVLVLVIRKDRTDRTSLRSFRRTY